VTGAVVGGRVVRRCGTGCIWPVFIRLIPRK